MRTLPLVFLSLALAACGEDAQVAPAHGDGTTVLHARSTPLETGDLAPAFEGLPDGPTVLVFYRGHW